MMIIVTGEGNNGYFNVLNAVSISYRPCVWFCLLCVSSSRVKLAPHHLSPTCSTCPTDRALSTRPLPRPPPPPLPRLSAWGSWSAVSVRHRSQKHNMPSNTENKIHGWLKIMCGQQWNSVAQRNKIISRNGYTGNTLNRVTSLLVLIFSWDLLKIQKYHQIYP